MKLYTEEQLKEFFNEHYFFMERDLDNLTPIKLPSDNELEEISKQEILYNDSKRGWWLEGASYILNVIKKQYGKDN